ncbi:unnamed protein product [Ectocarpus fasciculatus]
MIYNKARRMIYNNNREPNTLFNGDISVDNIPAEHIPLLCFVNTKSGGRYGVFAIKELRSLLNPVQVVDLQKSDPLAALQAFSRVPSFRVLVCGGDGSVRWILNCIEQLPRELRPPVAILPLGTGNDLARILGWGAGIGIGSASIPEVLQQVQRASVGVLDRWRLSIPDDGAKKKQKDVVFNNYFGIGVDAQIVLNFHTMREQSPEKFFSRLVNQLWYGVVGWKEIWTPHCTNLKRYIKLAADGKEVELPEDTQGLIFSNIPSFGGGMKLWEGGSAEGMRAGPLSSERWTVPSIQDKKIEVVAVTGSLHLAQLKLGLTGCTKLAQCETMEIETFRQLPFQVDGEPWVQSKCVVKLAPSESGPVTVLKRHVNQYGADQDISDVLNWAERGKIITHAQKSIILREFSRRRENS